MMINFKSGRIETQILSYIVILSTKKELRGPKRFGVIFRTIWKVDALVLLELSWSNLCEFVYLNLQLRYLNSLGLVIDQFSTKVLPLPENNNPGGWSKIRKNERKYNVIKNELNRMKNLCKIHVSANFGIRLPMKNAYSSPPGYANFRTLARCIRAYAIFKA